ncbi:uncharacterized protein LOC116120258 isoform X1 [Pistacia vera]|uniref:uncharacterized protein LOC116120258 isoform X1 n=1 Tax=Pistacia vera TaxID=55513 RepID=UPI001262BDEE|nr:uncharacterized protein LOC116120258 isoform X1 [Pistacia vera]
MELLVNSEEMMKKLIAAAEVDKEKFVRYWPLRRAIQQDDWKAVGEFTRDNYPQVFTDKISEISSTFFHVIVLLDNDAAISLLRENVPKFTESVLAKDASGATALSLAAALGNKKAVEIIVNSCPDSPNALLSMGPMSNILPIHLAAIFGHEEVVQFLLPRTRLLIEETQNQFLLVLFLLGVSNPLGITFRVFKNQLRDRGLHPKQKEWILGTLAAKPKWFKSGSRIGFLQRFIYSCIPVKDDNMPSPQAEKTDFQNPGSVDGDTEIPRQISEISASTFNSGMRQKLKSMFWNVLMQLAPCIKRIHDEKLNHMQALEIVRTVCGGVVWDFEKALETLKQPILIATRLGILEIVEEILKVYDSALFFVDEAGKNVLQLAVLNRQEIVFGFMLKEAGKFLSQYMDNDLNNILHLAGKSSTSSKIAGSVLQMQREVQWFKAVENFVLPSMREMKNKESKTPREVFEEEHKTLVKEGENSMKGSATSCSVVAALIITIAFAAAFTVPGGGTNTKGPAFIIFAISDALAFVSSTASVLMFLGILTMRYSPDDFLKSLPEKYRPNHLVLFYCKHDGSLWCNVLHQLHSSMEMDYLPNFPSY